MTVDQNLRSSPERTAHVLESGDIYFAYRPKIEPQAAKSFEDVARLYMILSPRGKQLYRFIIIGEKRLPAVSGGGDRKSWGFVEKVASRPEEVEDELDPETYPTKTRGERHLAAARPAGEGVYAIVRHSGHTHLAYALELPDEPGEVSGHSTSSTKAATSSLSKIPKRPRHPASASMSRAKPASPRNCKSVLRGAASSLWTRWISWTMRALKSCSSAPGRTSSRSSAYSLTRSTKRRPRRKSSTT